MPYVRLCRWLPRAWPVLLVAIWAAATSSPAQESPNPAADSARLGPRIVGVRIGFDGAYKVGCWTPIWVDLEGGREPIEFALALTARDPDGVPVRFDLRQNVHRLAANERKEILGYARFGGPRGPLTVELQSGVQVLANRSFTAGELPAGLPTSAELVLSVGGDIGAAEALRRHRRGASELVVVPRLNTAAALPDRWLGYEGVDVICWGTGQECPAAELTAEQLAALEKWVRLGGRLVLSVGKRGGELLASGAPFERFCPGAFSEVIEQRRSGEIERYAGASQPLVERDSPPLQVSVLSELAFREEAAEGTGAARHATIVRFPLGLGRVALAVFDLDRPPVSTWPGRVRLVARLLDLSADTREETPSERTLGQVTYLGFDDLGGQLHAALEQFSGVPLVSFSLVAAMLVVYMLLIGPADYYFLRRFTGRMEFTWATFPAVVVAASLLAVYLGASSKGSRQLSNRVEVLDLDLESGQARGACIANFYSPRTARLQLTPALTPPFELDEPEMLTAWHGLPGKGFGGMDSGQANAGVFDLLERAYEVEVPASGADACGIAGLPLQASSTKSVVARWSGGVKLPEAGRLAVDRDGRLTGEIINPLSVELQDAVLFYENSAYKLRSNLPPGERFVITSQSQVIHIERRLTQRRIVQSGETKAAWDPRSYELPRILEIMMFHETAGGRAYTGLASRQQPQFDLSGHLKLGRAILLARTDAPACRWQEGENPTEDGSNELSFVRFVYPVAKTTAAR